MIPPFHGRCSRTKKGPYGYGRETVVMRKCRHSWMQLWNKKSPPDLLWGLGWLCGTLAFVCIGHHVAKMIDHFWKDPTIGWYVANIGLAGATYCLFRSLRCAWNARSAIALFISLTPAIFVLVALKLQPPRALDFLAERLADAMLVLPLKPGRPVIMCYVLLVMFGIAVPSAAIVAWAAARYWRRAEIARGICACEEPQQEGQEEVTTE